MTDHPSVTRGEAFVRVEQTLQMIEHVVSQADMTLEDLAAVGRLSCAAMGALEGMLRPYLEDALEYYRFKSKARVCCQHWHPVVPWVQDFNILRERFSSAHGDFTTRHLALTGE